MVTTGLETAPAALGPADALRLLVAETPTDERLVGAWRWQVRRGLAPLRDSVVGHTDVGGSGLDARRGGCLRGQATLASRISALAPRVLHDPDVGRLRRDLRLLLDDVRRHEQRCRDLAYDEVELELGGSE